MARTKVIPSQITLDFAEGTLGATFASTASNTWQDSGFNITLPSAGTWLVMGDIRTSVATGSGQFCAVRLFNTTAAAAITNSERITGQSQTTSAGTRNTTPVFMRITTTSANNVIRIDIQPGGAYACSLESDNNGRTHLMALRIG